MNATRKLNVVLGAGPAGRTLAKQLMQKGEKVRLVSRAPRKSEMPEAIEWVAADLSKSEEAARAMEDAAMVYHCAAPAYEEWVRDFPVLQKQILAVAIANEIPMVMLDNLYGYGVAGKLSEDLPYKATGSKGRLRAEMAREALALHEAGRLKVAIARSTDFIGPEARMTALGDRFWPQLLQGKSITWFGNLDVAHSYTYLPDLAAAMIQLAESENAWGKAWHVPSLPAMSIRQIAEIAAGFSRIGTPKLKMTPPIMMKLIGVFIPAAGELIEVGYQFREDFELDWSRYKNAFHTEPTSVEVALKNTLDWWQTELGLTKPLPAAA